MSSSQAAAFTSSLIGMSSNDLTFRTVKQWACEGKILTAHSRAIQRSLHLSDAASNTFDATLLLYFAQLFKIIVWKTRCENYIKWELAHEIRHKDKCKQGLVTISDKEIVVETALRVVNTVESQRPHEFSLDDQLHETDTPDTSQIQVLDDIEIPIQPVLNSSNSIQDRITRRNEAAILTWKDMTTYVKHNYLSEWMPRMSKYFNKFTRMSDELWDDSVDLGVM